MFFWTQQRIDFLRDASEYSRFDAELAARLSPLLPRHGVVCDAGCGLGFLSLELARRCEQVAAVDRSPEALNVLRGNMIRQGIDNITVTEADVFAHWPAEKYAAMVFCFFGRVGETLQAAREQCAGRLIMVKKSWDTHRFSLSAQPLERCDHLRVGERLRALGLPVVCDSFWPERGQPLRSLAAAEAFFALYGGGEPLPTRAQLAEMLQPTGSDEFPYFLPSRKRIDIISLETEHISVDIINTLLEQEKEEQEK